MIKKLRLRFIISALLSILFVLSATIAAINISNFIKTEKEARHSIDMITENEHKDMQAMMGIGGAGGGFGFGGRTREDDQRNREHYFVVVFNTNGEISYYDYSHIFTITDEEAQELAMQIYQTGKTEGKVDSFYFKREQTVDEYKMPYYSSFEETIKIESTFLSFVDTTERMNTFRNFLTTSIVIASISYTVIAALIIISSHFVFKTSEESYRKQKAFITNASHELKTPLTIINTDVEILKMDHGENEWTDSIRDQVRRLTAMTNQLVTLSRLDEANMQNYPFANVALGKLAKESADAFAPTFEKSGYKFTSDIDEDLTIKGNQHLINELFYIFMDNALKYTKEKGEISLSVKKNKYRTEIIFSNDVEDDEMDTSLLFERFYRSPKSNDKEGSGIGLSIAKEIIDLHKARINVNVQNHKIYFVITL